MAALAGVKIGGPNQNPWGWFTELPANEDNAARHQVGVTPNDIPRTGWTREYDNPNVCQLRDYLTENNGIPGLELCEPHEVEKAAKLFHRDGFVAVRDCLSPELLAEMKATTDRAIMQAIESGEKVILAAFGGLIFLSKNIFRKCQQNLKAAAV